MTTHSYRVKALVLSIAFLLCVVLVPFKSVQADSFPSEFYVNSGVYYSASELFLAYSNLNYNQKEICAYILGMYNLMYLGSRGFVFKQGAYANESEFIAKIKSFGYRFLQGAAEIALKSRMDDNFCKYASACILYASQCNNVDFETWFSNLDSDFTIPVDQGILNSFTLLYNDNNDSSIETYGDVIGNWDSGVYIPNSLYNYGVIQGISNYLQNVQNNYEHMNFLTPTIYTNSIDQSLYYFNDGPDTIILLKNSSGKYTKFAWGHYYGESFHRLNFEVYKQKMFTAKNNLTYDEYNESTYNFERGEFNIDSSVQSDLSESINWVFNNYIPIASGRSTMNNYPWIDHVVIVTNLSSLANLEEVYNTDSWDILSLGQSNMVVPVDYVDIKPKVITSINLPDNTQVQVNIKDIIYNPNSSDPGVEDPSTLDPVNPWQITIIVQPNDTNPISIDVNLFSSAKVYVDYVWNSSIKFLTYCKQLLDCVGFVDNNGGSYGPKYAIFGVVTLGIAGGLIAKFLL